MKKKIYLVGLIFMLILSSVLVTADPVITSSSVTLRLVANDTIEVSSQQGSVNYSISTDLSNGSKTYTYQYIADISCPQESLNENLINYTQIIANACAVNIDRIRYCDTIKDENTNISLTNILLRNNQSLCDQTKVDYVNLKANYDNLNAQQPDLQSKSKTADNLVLYVGLAALIGALIMWGYYNRGKFARSSSNPPSAMSGGTVGEQTHQFPERFESAFEEIKKVMKENSQPKEIKGPKDSPRENKG